MICIVAMKSKLHLEIYESEVLRSLATQSKDETFDFVSKMLNHYEYPTETANELIEYIEDYIVNFQRNEYENELLTCVDDRGHLTGKYKDKRKKQRLNKKPQKVPEEKEYISQYDHLI